jgi:hypothetical protein
MHQRQHPSHLASHPHIAATARSGQNPAKKYPRGIRKPSVFMPTTSRFYQEQGEYLFFSQEAFKFSESTMFKMHQCFM